jgi:hypothetical protein
VCPENVAQKDDQIHWPGLIGTPAMAGRTCLRPAETGHSRLASPLLYQLSSDFTAVTEAGICLRLAIDDHSIAPHQLPQAKGEYALVTADCVRS